jgi:GDPmannose 4,6-dehydratase
MEGNMQTALITGITGQDGSYLAEFLLEKGYEVHGIIRRASTFNTSRIDHIFKNPNLTLHYGDMSDGSCLRRIVRDVCPDEVYNLAAQSHVAVSFEVPEYTNDIVANGTLRLLEAVRSYDESIRFYQAGSSEMFGSARPPQWEETEFKPCSPYGVAKVAAHHHCVTYRDSYGMFVCNGILFNHESSRRGETFVTRKITRAATRIKLGLQNQLVLGNLNAKRDWGFAGDYVQAMWLMLNQDEPGDYVIATGEAYTVHEFLSEVFNYLDLDIEKYVSIHKDYFRPKEVDFLLGNPEKAKKKLGWEPTTDMKALAKMMVDSDMELAKEEAYLLKRGDHA